MLVLSRKQGEEIVIDGRIIVRIVEVHGNRVRVGIEAPKEIEVHRREIFDDNQFLSDRKKEGKRP
jgi:carbon storage regulator